MKRRQAILFSVLAACCAAVVVFGERVALAASVIRQRSRKNTVADRLAEFGAAARRRWSPHFARASAAYPPPRATLLVLKRERVLEVYVPKRGVMVPVRSFAILAASGGPGPKLREGDRQVPEGTYRIESLNPNSAFHVSLRLNYPNESDRAQARKEGRKNLGGDIMIHGNSVSIGCVAIGDEGAEDIFTLAADVGMSNITVLIAPFDFRKHQNGQAQGWVKDLYENIRAELAKLPTK